MWSATVVCTINARFAPSNIPLERNSLFPPKYFIIPSFFSCVRYSISISSSAGTAQRRIRPDNSSRTPGSLSAAAIPRSAADCAE